VCLAELGDDLVELPERHWLGALDGVVVCVLVEEHQVWRKRRPYSDLSRETGQGPERPTLWYPVDGRVLASEASHDFRQEGAVRPHGGAVGLCRVGLRRNLHFARKSA
jgi:hypothetical protein